jgi:hypothetical protein
MRAQKESLPLERQAFISSNPKETTMYELVHCLLYTGLAILVFLRWKGLI